MSPVFDASIDRLRKLFNPDTHSVHFFTDGKPDGFLRYIDAMKRRRDQGIKKRQDQLATMIHQMQNRQSSSVYSGRVEGMGTSSYSYTYVPHNALTLEEYKLKQQGYICLHRFDYWVKEKDANMIHQKITDLEEKRYNDDIESIKFDAICDLIDDGTIDPKDYVHIVGKWYEETDQDDCSDGASSSGSASSPILKPKEQSKETCHVQVGTFTEEEIAEMKKKQEIEAEAEKIRKATKEKQRKAELAKQLAEQKTQSKYNKSKGRK